MREKGSERCREREGLELRAQEPEERRALRTDVLICALQTYAKISLQPIFGPQMPVVALVQLATGTEMRRGEKRGGKWRGIMRRN